MQLLDDIRFTAPPPAGAQGETQAVGLAGIRQYWYWVVAHFPIGAVIGGPFFIRNAPDILSADNSVLIVWDVLPGVRTYDLLRTASNQFPAAAGNHAAAIGLTQTHWRDQGEPLIPYDPTGLPYGSPVSCRITLNNRNYKRPTLEMPCAIRVHTIVFDDGTEQDTAAGGGAELIAGDGITLLENPGPPKAITINSDIYSWQQDIEANEHNLLNLGRISFDGAGPVWLCTDANGSLEISDRNRTGRMWVTQDGRVGIGTNSPASLVHLYEASGQVVQTFQRGTQQWRVGPGINYNNDFVVYDGNASATVSTVITLATPTDYVGIGTAYPVSRLTVLSTLMPSVFTPALTLQFANSYMASVPGEGTSIDWMQQTDPSDIIGRISVNAVNGAQAYAMAFYAYNGSSLVESVRIDWNGRVGIGTTTPQARLDVAGLVRTMSATLVSPTSGIGVEMYFNSAQGQGYLRSYDYGAAAQQPLTIGGTPITLSAGNYGSYVDCQGGLRIAGMYPPGTGMGIDIAYDRGALGRSKIRCANSAISPNNQRLGFYANPLIIARAEYGSGGYPGWPEEVGSTLIIQLSTYDYIEFGYPFAFTLYPYNTHTIGARSTDPNIVWKDLQIQGRILWFNSVSSPVTDPNTNYIGFLTDSVERARITRNGYVGIGKTNPGSPLAVNGFPSTSAGLTSGDVWADAAAAYVLKVVP